MSDASTGAPSTSAPSPVPTGPQPTEGQSAQEGTTTPTPPAKRKFKYKADESEIEEELDDTEISSRLALAKAATNRMKEAASTRKQVEDIFRRLKENPMEVLSDDRLMGTKKFREIAENFLIEQLKMEQMTPEERQRMDRDKELEHYKQQEKLRKEQEEQQRASKLETQYQQQFEQTIMGALAQTNLPKNAQTVARMAKLLQLSIKNGVEADASQLAKMVNENYANELKSIIKDASAEQILAMFGDDIANKIRKHDLSKFTPKNPAPVKPTERTESIGRNLSPREFDEQLRNRFNK